MPHELSTILYILSICFTAPKRPGDPRKAGGKSVDSTTVDDGMCSQPAVIHPPGFRVMDIVSKWSHTQSTWEIPRDPMSERLQ